MSFKQGLIAARSRIILLAGMAMAIYIITRLEHIDVKRFVQLSGSNSAVGSWSANAASFTIEATANIPHPSPSELSAEEQEWARIAWKYFENNYQPQTGLVNSVDNYPASTMWDTGSYLLALISAQRLGIISTAIFEERLAKALDALATLPLFDEELPNKSYNTITKEMADYTNKPTPRGIGWSAIDVGRLFIPLHIITWRYPQYAASVQKVLQRMKFTNAVKQGILYGATTDDSSRTLHPQEGRIGYEEYASKSYSLMGVDVFAALKYDDYIKFEDIYGVQVPTDARTPDRYKQCH